MKRTIGILFCIVPYLVMLLIRTAGVVLFGNLFADGLASNYNVYVIYVLALVTVIYVLVFGVWYYFDIAKGKKTGNSDFWNTKSLFLLFVLGIAAQMSVSFLLYFLFLLLPSLAEGYEALMSPLVALTPMSIIYVGILSPISEELIFRGLIMRYAEKYAPFYLANILQAALFGVYHGNLIQGIYAFLLGLLIGYLARLSGSVFGGIIFHSALNFAGLYLERLLPETMSAAVRLTLMLASAAVCVWSVKVLGKHENIGQK